MNTSALARTATEPAQAAPRTDAPARASADGRRRIDTGSVVTAERGRLERNSHPPVERRPRDQEEAERRRQGQRARLRHQDHARDHRERQVAPPRHVERVEHLDPEEQRRERDARLVDRPGELHALQERGERGEQAHGEQHLRRDVRLVALPVREHVADGRQRQREDRRRPVHATLRDDGEDRDLHRGRHHDTHRDGVLGRARRATHPLAERRHGAVTGSRASASSSGMPSRHG